MNIDKSYQIMHKKFLIPPLSLFFSMTFLKCRYCGGQFNPVHNEQDSEDVIAPILRSISDLLVFIFSKLTYTSVYTEPNKQIQILEIHINGYARTSGSFRLLVILVFGS